MLKILFTSLQRPLQSTPLSSLAWRTPTVVVEMYSLMGIVAGVTTNFRSFSVVKAFFRCQFCHGEVDYRLVLDT